MKYLDLSINDKLRVDALRKFDAILESGQFILGDECAALESEVKKYLNCKFAIAVNSGFDALVLALKANNIGCGDEVITVSNTFVATVSAIYDVGAKPVLIDVDDTRNINPNLIISAISKKTKAILPVHLGGYPCDMPKILEIAKQYGLVVIEDAAQSLGSMQLSKKLGTFGDCGCFSFHPTKILGGVGDGGMVVTDNEELYNKIVLLRNHGLKNRDECNTWGRNSRLDEIQAALLRLKLSYIEMEIDKRLKIAERYTSAFKRTKCEVAIVRETDRVSYFTYTLQCDQRDALLEHLKQNGIDSRIHYPSPIHKQVAYKKLYGDISLPKTEIQAGRILSLPINGKMTEIEIDLVVNTTLEFFCNV